MQITFQTKLGVSFTFCIGFNNQVFSQMYFITTHREYFHYDEDGRKVTDHIDFVHDFFKHPKFWFR